MTPISLYHISLEDPHSSLFLNTQYLSRDPPTPTSYMLRCLFSWYTRPTSLYSSHKKGSSYQLPAVPAPQTESKKREPSGVLIYIAGGIGQIQLIWKITTIGKHPTSDIVVKGLLIDPTSVTINQRPNGFSLDYIGWLPRPKVNDQTVKKSTILNDFDIIEIGQRSCNFLPNLIKIPRINNQQGPEDA